MAEYLHSSIAESSGSHTGSNVRRTSFDPSLGGSEDDEQGRISRSSTSFMKSDHPQFERMVEIIPEGSVYSYFQFMPTIEQRRDEYKRLLTPLTLYAFVLVGVNFVMQFGLLVVVGQWIIQRHSEWVGSIAYLKHKAWYHVGAMPYNKPPGRCRTAQSPLCYDHDGQISCSPPSIQVLGEWDVLDVDGDGVWSRDEASDWNLREEVNCKHNLDLLALYDSVTRSLNNSHILEDRRDPKLMCGHGIHKAYLDWYLHKPMLCMYGDADMCGNLFQRGFFDVALKDSPLRAFKDPATALRYCERILRHECFHILPGTYTVWRLLSNQQCGEKRFSQGLYENPADATNDESIPTPVLTVDFKKREIYETTQKIPFSMFLTILLVTFTSVMYLEMKSMMKSLLWTIYFPVDKPTARGDRRISREAVEFRRQRADEDPFSPRLDDQLDRLERAKTSVPQDDAFTSRRLYKINMVRSDHRWLVLAVTVLRVFLWFFLLYSGIMFLTGAPKYLNLIFDALSLVFIFEIDELLYRNMVRDEFAKEHLEIMPMYVKAPFWVASNKVYADIFNLLTIVSFCMLIVWTYTTYELTPLFKSLSCVCLQQGESCLEATKYSKDWWDIYWSRTFPKANQLIDGLLDY
mmetsp:Transcript_101523/g.179997  ORF Transcript_101523/g.179997 Transcript_101523/m.179997 type:complete len:632 (+) Transcript_101523:164-2059(+)